RHLIERANLDSNEWAYNVENDQTSLIKVLVFRQR
ncbi:hypothetical protein PanWU01x14_172910, partial [Parasponia andersonii]